jgi:hypothetical protein
MTPVTLATAGRERTTITSTARTTIISTTSRRAR